ncbi:MAG: cytidine deaminase [Spirochaetaceae bacterium]|nr:cytidine deaminase [Spirochaetaceae bacterium]
MNELFERAKRAALSAYAPYSRFRVGAALLAESGAIYTGCNVENRSYGLTICAERNALALAVGSGERSFAAIAVAALDSDVPVGPCGACRQVLSEFMKPEAQVRFGGACGKIVDTTIGILYPYDSLQGFAPPEIGNTL